MASAVYRQRPAITAVLCGLLALAASPACANIGLPTIGWVMPASWLLLVPVVCIEAFAAVRVLETGFWRALKLTAIANVCSTLVGIPVAWIILAILESLFAGTAPGLETFWQKLYAVTIQSPWLMPYDAKELRWMLPAAGISLCIPFYFASVFCEYKVVNSLIPKHRSQVTRWAWTANAITYSLTVVGLAVLLIRALV